MIYTPIAKNANTTLKRLFVRLSGHPEWQQILHGVHTYLTSHRTGLSLCDYTPEEATEIFHDPAYFRFVVLRNPLERVVSGYLDKFILFPPPVGENGESPIVISDAIDWVYAQRREEPDYQRSITFEEFVDYLVLNDDQQLDTHFKSQQCCFMGQEFDFIGTIENMGRLVSVLETQFGQTFEMEHSNRIVNKKPLFRRRRLGQMLPAQIRTLKRLPHASELLTDRVRAHLESRFARDIELWKEAVSD